MGLLLWKTFIFHQPCGFYCEEIHIPPTMGLLLWKTFIFHQPWGFYCENIHIPPTMGLLLWKHSYFTHHGTFIVKTFIFHQPWDFYRENIHIPPTVGLLLWKHSYFTHHGTFIVKNIPIPPTIGLLMWKHSYFTHHRTFNVKTFIFHPPWDFYCENIHISPTLVRGFPVCGLVVMSVFQLHVSNLLCDALSSLVRALRSLANRRRVSVFPLANQRRVYVSIGNGSCLTAPPPQESLNKHYSWGKKHSISSTKKKENNLSLHSHFV